MKSEIEKEFDVLSDKYYEKFNENYPVCIVGHVSLKEICEDMKRCIETGEKKPPLEYDEGADY